MIDALRTKTGAQVRRAVSGFAEKYVLDWGRWVAADSSDRPTLFVKTLGKWQAVRPNPLRRLRARSHEHPPPYIEDLLEATQPHLKVLAGFFVGRIMAPTTQERRALSALWAVFSELPQRGQGSCVAITKAALLLSEGRVGPAFDSKVRYQLGCGRLQSAREWAEALGEVSADIQAFEIAIGSTLASVVPRRFATLANGRLYDMALGPR